MPSSADERAIDQVLAALHQHDDRDVVGDQVVVDQRAHEVEVGLRRRREADLDLLEAHLDQQLEQAALAVAVHRVDQRLVAVAEVDGDPLRGGGQTRRSGHVRSGSSTAAYGTIAMGGHAHGETAPGRRWKGERRAGYDDDGKDGPAGTLPMSYVAASPYRGRRSSASASRRVERVGVVVCIAGRDAITSGGGAGAPTTRTMSRRVTRKLHEYRSYTTIRVPAIQRRVELLHVVAATAPSPPAPASSCRGRGA